MLFTLLGFMGMYALLSMLFLLLRRREIAHGPDGGPGHGPVTPTGQEG